MLTRFPSDRGVANGAWGLALETAEPGDAMLRPNWIERATGGGDLPPRLLRAVRSEQIERACKLAPYMGLGLVVVATAMFCVARFEPSAHATSWTQLTWLGGTLALAAWLVAGARMLVLRKGPRRLLFSTAQLHAILQGAAWGGAPLVLSPAAGEATATVLLGAGGMLFAACLILTIVPIMSLVMAAAGMVMLTLSAVATMSPVNAACVIAMIAMFAVAFPFFTMSSERGFLRRRYEGFLSRQRHEAARFLLESHEAQGDEWLWQCDDALRMVNPSPRLRELAGLAPGEGHGLEAADFLARTGMQPDAVAALLDAVRTNRPFERLTVALQRDVGNTTRLYHWSISGRPRLSREGRLAGFVGIGRDVTREHEARRELVRLAETDALTGLSNRRFFQSFLANATRRENDGRFAVMMLDLERFRSINETFGHTVGDALLVEASERIAACLSEWSVENHCLARLAGDEFALLLDGLGRAGAARVAAAIAEALARPFSLGGRAVRTSARIGIALAPTHAAGSGGCGPDDTDCLLQRADLALSRVKASGRASWLFFEHEMDLDQRARIELEADLSEHLQSATPERYFELLFQPLVDPADGMPRGMEALIRWHHPKHGTVSPATFIPMAERLGLIERIGRWSLLSACAEAARWKGATAPRVAVNISAPHFAGGLLVDHVREALSASGLDPDRLEIEVTESVLVEEHGAERTLAALHALGVYVALDDFGTGYSSLAYLQRFSFDKLKIDRRFVVSGEQDDRSKRILAMIVELGHTLDMSVVAEGIETPAQARMTAGLGCDLLQGYLFARPLAVADARELLAASACAPAGEPASDAAMSTERTAGRHATKSAKTGNAEPGNAKTGNVNTGNAKTGNAEARNVEESAVRRGIVPALSIAAA